LGLKLIVYAAKGQTEISIRIDGANLSLPAF